MSLLNFLVKQKPETSGKEVISTKSLFMAWFIIGLQTFGGGASIAYMVQREFIYKRHWITQENFVYYCTICDFTPGIFFVSFPIILGYKVKKFSGSLACLLGLMLPSTTISILMTSGFSLVHDLSITKAVLQGVIPATIGLSFLRITQFGLPLLKLGKQEGKESFVFHLLLILICILLVWLLNIATTLVLMFSAISSAVLLPFIWGRLSNQRTDNKKRG